MIDCAHGCASYCSARCCSARAAVIAQLPNLSPFLEGDFDDRMIDLSSKHVSETESDEEERMVAVDLEGVEETGKKKRKNVDVKGGVLAIARAARWPLEH